MGTFGLPHARLADLQAVRFVTDNVLTAEQCRELVFILKATSTVGYRPHVRSATIHDVVATAPWMLPPLARARAEVLAAVEAAFGLSLELCVEFSGLIGWGAGAALGWHHDANRDYLSQRHLSAVLYLNDQGADFGAGDFRFQDGPEPLRVAPRAGRLVSYTADARNVHCVEAVEWGERATLTLWFSLEPAAAEDGKVLEQLQRYEALLRPPREPFPVERSPLQPHRLKQPSPRELPPPQPPAAVPPPAPPDAAGAGDRRGPVEHIWTATATASSATTPKSPASPQPGESRGADEADLAPQPAAPAISGLAQPGLGSAPAAPCFWMGRGLPDTMYALPAAIAGSAVEDLRVERIRSLGLRLWLHPASESGPQQDGSQAGLVREEGVAGAQAWPNSQPIDRAAVVVWTESEASGSFDATCPLAEGSEKTEFVRATRPEEATTPPRELRFASLAEALVAVQYAACTHGCARIGVQQVESALPSVQAYVAARTNELRVQLPGWLALGSMLS